MQVYEMVEASFPEKVLPTGDKSSSEQSSGMNQPKQQKYQNELKNIPKKVYLLSS
jgi:hypothetical protein